jgi:hypothetical protein
MPEFFFKPLYSSVTAGDVVPISPCAFITVLQRQLNGDQEHSGVVMFWVTFE